MKKIYLGIIIILLSGGLIAQNFQEVIGTPFTGVTNGDMATIPLNTEMK